jgi:hypothetical protein
MKITHQYELNAFRRVQDFLDHNGVKIGALVDSEGRKLLDASVAQIEAHGVDQASWQLEINGHVSLQKSLEAEIRKQHMQPIADYSRARLRGVPDGAALTRSTMNLRGHALVRAARAMAAAAAPHADAFTRNGFPADTIAQLNAAADKLEATIDGRANLRVRRAGATKGIAEQAKQAHEAVKMLNAVVGRYFAKDKTFLAAWRSAKRIAAKPGISRGSAVAADSTDAAVPAIGKPEEVAISA